MLAGNAMVHPDGKLYGSVMLESAEHDPNMLPVLNVVVVVSLPLSSVDVLVVVPIDCIEKSPKSRLVREEQL